MDGSSDRLARSPGIARDAASADLRPGYGRGRTGILSRPSRRKALLRTLGRWRNDVLIFHAVLRVERKAFYLRTPDAPGERCDHGHASFH
jgi:hypothetical protein